MGKPRRLVEAVSSYRGDREDRLTEMLAAALDAHDPFCRLFLTKASVRASPASVSVHTQASLDGQARLVDLVIRGLDHTPDPLSALFVENKYNPDRQANPYWFTDDQGRRQYTALERELAPERHLIGVASRSDLWRDVPCAAPWTSESQPRSQVAADQAGSKHTGDSQTAPNQGRGPVAPDAGVAGDAVAQVARSRGLVRWLAEPRTPPGGTCLARRAFDFDRPPDLNAREHKPVLPRGREVYRY